MAHLLLASGNAARPTVVCLCGSTRFHDAFQAANYGETMAGRIVLTVGFYPHSSEVVHGEALGCTDEQKEALDRLHFRKIEMADEVLVLNVGGHIGDSTQRELAYARSLGKRVRSLEPLTSDDESPDFRRVPVQALERNQARVTRLSRTARFTKYLAVLVTAAFLGYSADGPAGLAAGVALAIGVAVAIEMDRRRNDPPPGGPGALDTGRYRVPINREHALGSAHPVAPLVESV